MYPELQGWRASHLEGSGQIVRKALYDDRIAAERKVRSVLLSGAHRHQQRRSRLQPLANRARGHLFQPPGASCVSHRVPWWVVVVLAATIAAGEWLRRPATASAALSVVAFLIALLALRPFGGYRRSALATVLAALALALSAAQWQLGSIERHWPEQRKLRIDAAYRRLGGDLHSAFRSAERLAAAAAATAGADRRTAFEVLDRLVPSTGPEMTVVLLDPKGQPWAWAGRQRLAPSAQGDSVGSRSTGYYVELEARRHTAAGGSAVAGVLIWAHPAVPDRGRSLAELFRKRTEVDLVVYSPGAAPDSADVFDYEEPTTAGSASAVQRPAGAGGARHRQGAGVRARRRSRHMARARRARLCVHAGYRPHRPHRGSRLGRLARR